MDDVCHYVEIETLLQSLQGASFDNTSTTRNEAPLDIKANDQWGHRFTRCFVDVKIFIPLAKTPKHQPLIR